MNYKNGQILIPLLFVVIAFGILMTSGAMVNKSTTDKTEEFGEAQVENSPGKQNLQLKTASFQLKPTPSKSCAADSGEVVGPDCMCPDVHYVCKDGKCVDVLQEKSGMKGYTCNSPWGQTVCNYPKEDGGRCYGKPVIYLYPTVPTLVDVSIKTKGRIVVSIPTYPAHGWKNVLAMPSGELVYQGNHYRELFYETSVDTVTQPDTGFVINRRNLHIELLSFITKLGLTKEDEQQEFLDWWIPRLEDLNSPYIFVSLVNQKEKDENDRVFISPKPDTFINFIVYFKPLNKYEKVEKLVLPPTPKRIGFTAVEWGGVIDR